jgi:hypothetical protein
MADRQAFADRILALEDVNVGAADRRGRDAQQGIERPDIGDGLVPKDNTAFLGEHRRLHRCHAPPPFRIEERTKRQCRAAMGAAASHQNRWVPALFPNGCESAKPVSRQRSGG